MAAYFTENEWVAYNQQLKQCHSCLKLFKKINENKMVGEEHSIKCSMTIAQGALDAMQLCTLNLSLC